MARKLFQKVCEICGKDFTASTTVRRYCGKECAAAGKKMNMAKPRKQSGFQRKCHDCGRPTNNYRCRKCWAKLRGKNEDWNCSAETDGDFVYG